MSATDFGDPHQVIHIPARDLTGTREAKLAELDMFVAQLQVVRLAICGQVVRLEEQPVTTKKAPQPPAEHDIVPLRPERF